MQIDLPDDPVVLQQVVPELQAENEKLWRLIQRLLRHRYGPGSEQLDLDQLQLVLEDAEQSAAESEAAKDTAARRGGQPQLQCVLTRCHVNQRCRGDGAPPTQILLRPAEIVTRSQTTDQPPISTCAQATQWCNVGINFSPEHLPERQCRRNLT